AAGTTGRDEDVGEVLADSPAPGEGAVRRRGDVGGAALVVEGASHGLHQGNGGAGGVRGTHVRRERRDAGGPLSVRRRHPIVVLVEGGEVGALRREGIGGEDLA